SNHPSAGAASVPPGGAQPTALETGAATSVTASTATLGGTVNPDGGTVSSCRFEYGTTTSYGSSTPCSSLPGPGSTAVGVSAQVSGLGSGIMYHFRVAATNGAGTSLGPDLSFITPQDPPSAQPAAASAIAQT